jgi:hypothetical protein
MFHSLLAIEPFAQRIVFLWHYAVPSNAFDGHVWATALQLNNVAFTETMLTHVAILFRCGVISFPPNARATRSS